MRIDLKTFDLDAMERALMRAALETHAANVQRNLYRDKRAMQRDTDKVKARIAAKEMDLARIEELAKRLAPGA